MIFASTRFFSKGFSYKDLNKETLNIGRKIIKVTRGLRELVQMACERDPKCVGFSCMKPRMGKTSLPTAACMGHDPTIYADWQLCTSVNQRDIKKEQMNMPRTALWAKKGCRSLCPKDGTGHECSGSKHGYVKIGLNGECTCICATAC